MATLNDKLYDLWRNMHTRCYDPSYHSYHRYGGRGIVVAAPWHDFQQFKRDIEPQYQPHFSLDRIDNDGPYSLQNCRLIHKKDNRKPYKVNPYQLLAEYTAGESQAQLALKYETDQPHISRLLKKARHGTAP